MINIKFNNDNQAFIKVRIIPKSSKNEIMGTLEDGSIKVKIKEAPEKGKANTELVRFLKKELEINNVEIISGKSDRVKLIRLKK